MDDKATTTTSKPRQRDEDRVGRPLRRSLDRLPRIVLPLLTVLLATAVAAAPAIAQPPPAPTGVSCDVPRDEPAFDPDATVEIWSGDVPADAAGGTLEVRSHRAGAYVVPWEDPARGGWEVEVGEIDPRDELEVTVEADEGGGGGGAFDLRVVVARSSPLPVDVQVDAVQQPRAQVKVRVPQTAFDRVVVADHPEETPTSVTLLSLQTDQLQPEWMGLRVGDLAGGELTVDGDVADVYAWNVTFGAASLVNDNGEMAVADATATEEVALGTDNGDVCVRRVAAPTIHLTSDNGRIDAKGLDAGGDGLATLTTDNGEIAARDLTTGRAELSVDNGDLTLVRARCEALQVRVDNGEVRLEDVACDGVDARGDNQDMEAVGLAVRNVTYISSNGGLDADLVPLGSGTWDLRADNGRIALHVPTGPDIGYDATARLDNGEPTLDIPGTSVVERGDGYVHVRTDGYADRPVQVEVAIEADNGEIAADDEVRSTGGVFGVPPGTATAAAAGVGLLGGLAAAAYLMWPKLKFLGAGLYSRIGRDDVLAHDVRRRIRDEVAAEPGIHFRELKRRLGVGRGILEHHLDKLVDADVLSEASSTGYRCYFPHGRVDRQVMQAAAALRSDTARTLLRAVAARPGASLSDLARAAGMATSTASYHLDRLVEAGLVAKGRDGSKLSLRVTPTGRTALGQLQLA